MHTSSAKLDAQMPNWMLSHIFSGKCPRGQAPDISFEKRTSLLRTYRAGEADHGRQPSLGTREPVGVLFHREGGGVGVDHGVRGGVKDDADVPGGGRGPVGSGEEDQVARLDLAGGDL